MNTNARVYRVNCSEYDIRVSITFSLSSCRWYYQQLEEEAIKAKPKHVSLLVDYYKQMVVGGLTGSSRLPGTGFY